MSTESSAAGANGNGLAGAKRRDTDADIVREFGGPVGAVGLMLFSHAIVYYLWISQTYYRGALLHPESISDIGPFLGRMWDHIAVGAAPTLAAAAIYLGFLVLQFVLAATMPGVWVQGLPVPSEGGVQHRYLCNGAASWYVTLTVVAGLHFSGIFPVTELADRIGPLITVGVIIADVLALVAYLVCVARGRQTRMSGNVVYDYFMGAVLNPRVGRVDLKFWAEIRVAWILLFLLTLSAAAKQYELYGQVSGPMIFMIVAHGLYTNACMKGEECIPTTWDVFYEKWGWMLIFWNFVGVPFVYCFQSFYILANNPQHSTAYTVALFVLLLGAYYVWDTSQSQRNRFRMMQRGTYVKRKAFPQLPWGTLHNPRYLETDSGSRLLTDGWWRYARKIHYSADIVMATTWGLACGFGGILPYFYPIFFVLMITHRYVRDTKRCKRKYGKDWDRYCEIVRYRFIPYVF